MSWHDCTLGDLMTLKRGHDLPNSKRIEGKIPVVSSSGITGFHNEAKANPPGVVTGRYGTLGEVFFLDEPYWPLNTALYVVDFKNTNPKFAAYFLRQTLKAYKSDKAAVPGVDRKVLHALKVKAPNAHTQERIVETLSAYDDLIENNKRRIALLEESARQLYKEWFVRFRFPGHEHVSIVDGVPEGWDTGCISDFYNTTSGGTPSRKISDLYDGDINWVKTQELHEKFIFSTNEKITRLGLEKSSAKVFPSGTVLVSMYGGTNIGRTGILAIPGASNQACCALLQKDKRANFIYTSLFFYFKRNELISMSQGAAQTNINQQAIRNLSINFAPESIMSSFIDNLDPVYELIKNLQLQNQKLTKARDLLIPKLMRGELAV